MIDLAQQPPGQYVPLKEIALRQGISMSSDDVAFMDSHEATAWLAGCKHSL